MSNSGIPSPLFPFLLLLTLTPSLAYPPCSSLQTSPLTSETLTHLSTGCTLQPHDPFIITLQSNPNLQLSHLQIHLRTPKDTISFTLLKTNDGYNLQTINDRVSQSDNTYITPPQAIVFEVKNGSYSLNLIGSSITSSHKLNNVTTYLLTIQISEPGFLSHASSTRFLEQCGNGTFLMGGSCLRACPAKFYASKGVCWHCSCPNGKCISENQCNPCTSGQVYFHETQTCVDECPDTYFEDSQNQVCAKCADGCTSCSYPDGNCNSGFIKLDPVLCVLVAVAALAAIIAVVWYWKMFKAKPKQPTKKKKKQQQPEQNAESSPKAKSKLAQLRRFGDAMTPVGPYNIMPEPPEHHDEDEEEMSPGGRNRRRKLTTVAQTKLLTVSRSKTFQVDDDNHEQAVDHGSPAMRPKLSSLTMLSTKGGESPAIRPRKAGKKTSKILSSRSRQDTQENKMLSIPIDESGAMQQSFELASPANASTPKRDTSTSLGFITLKKVDTTDTPLNNQDSAQASDRKEENEFAKVVEAVEEAEERDEEDEEKKEKEGYKPDLSLSISMDEDHMVELMTCTICGMNKRDCVNKPCGHMLGCYACMQQFREKYGVCPRCKVPMLKLEKTGELKIKAKSPKKEEE